MKRSPAHRPTTLLCARVLSGDSSGGDTVSTKSSGHSDLEENQDVMDPTPQPGQDVVSIDPAWETWKKPAALLKVLL